MSDMNTPEVPAEAVAPEAPAEAPSAAEPAAEAQVSGTEAPEVTPVVARTPSSESPTQAPEAAPEEETVVRKLEEITRDLVDLVNQHRTAGDSDLGSVVAEAEAVLPTPEPEEAPPVTAESAEPAV